MVDAEELRWIYSALLARGDAYSLGHVVDAGKDYCTDDVHRAGMEKGNYGIYGKIRDLVKVRLMEAVSAERLDRGIAAKELDVYYYAPMRGVEEAVEWRLSEGDRRMLERVGLYVE